MDLGPMELDEDTRRLLQIAEHFLGVYFGHDEASAHRLTEEFITSSGLDADFVHHEGAYRVAAAIHYLQALGGERNKLGHWLPEGGFNRVPAEAMEYFNVHYFDPR